jgi:hypothetical protein
MTTFVKFEESFFRDIYPVEMICLEERVPSSHNPRCFIKLGSFKSVSKKLKEAIYAERLYCIAPAKTASAK